MTSEEAKEVADISRRPPTTSSSTAGHNARSWPRTRRAGCAPSVASPSRPIAPMGTRPQHDSHLQTAQVVGRWRQRSCRGAHTRDADAPRWAVPRALASGQIRVHCCTARCPAWSRRLLGFRARRRPLRPGTDGEGDRLRHPPMSEFGLPLPLLPEGAGLAMNHPRSHPGAVGASCAPVAAEPRQWSGCAPLSDLGARRSVEVSAPVVSPGWNACA